MERPFAVIIPAYYPMNTLPNYISHLINENVALVIVINDGNPIEYNELFEQIKSLNRTVVLTHSTNKGKGAGLKTAFKYLEDLDASIKGAVTADADGQHLIQDVLNIGDALIEKDVDFVIGVRDFTEPQVPLRSKIGNFLASHLFKLLFKYYLHDTQTGLRGVKNSQFHNCSSIDGAGFEYEINMLIYIARNRLSFYEERITTVYHDEHFSNYQTFSDSFSIGMALMKGYFGDEFK
ncbi:glycosyltransferase family 2 protein [Aerococcaceae bacterium DSM 111020]|nr:glycosyltransferase family 2 protein [Aerococcaceae bacterium DSM 111020]